MSKETEFISAEPGLIPDNNRLLTLGLWMFKLTNDQTKRARNYWKLPEAQFHQGSVIIPFIYPDTLDWAAEVGKNLVYMTMEKILYTWNAISFPDTLLAKRSINMEGTGNSLVVKKGKKEMLKAVKAYRKRRRWYVHICWYSRSAENLSKHKTHPWFLWEKHTALKLISNFHFLFQVRHFPLFSF